MKLKLDTQSKLQTYAWGWLWAVWPMIGIRYFMAIGFFALFKMPQKVAFITNYAAMGPFLLLYFPHLRLGEWVWRADRLDYTFRAMWDYVSTDPFGALFSLVPSIGHAITGWLILAPFHFITGYLVFWVWFRFWSQK